MLSISGQKDCKCGVEYKHHDSGGFDYIVGGTEIDSVSKESVILTL